jgi:hypothetical protein
VYDANSISLPHLLPLAAAAAALLLLFLLLIVLGFLLRLHWRTRAALFRGPPSHFGL